MSTNGYKCVYQTKGRGNLKRHKLSRHEGFKYECNQCDFQTKHKTSLKIHQLSAHEGIKFACGQCNYQSTYKINLKTHKQSSTKGAVHEIGKLGSNGPFSYADHNDMVHFGLSGFFSGVLVHQSIAPQT